jgi:hypothetical protein
VNIIDAIKSGKRFRRKSWTGRDYIEANVYSLDLRIEALVADDWEVEEVCVTITESVLSAAWEKAVKSSGYHDDFAPHGWLYTELKKELGL